MNNLLIGELDTDSCAKERVMLERLLGNVKAFYNNPDNLQAFEAWKKNKEDMTYGTNHNSA